METLDVPAIEISTLP